MTSWNSSSRPQTPGNSSRLFGNDFPLFDFPSFNLNRPMSENSSSIPNFFRPGSFFRHSEQTSQSNTRSPPPSQPSTSRTNNNGNRGDTCESCDACNSKFNLFKRRKICNSCGIEYCASCFNKETNVGTLFIKQKCLKCRVFNCHLLNRSLLMKLPVRDLRWYLRSKRISANFCNEKSELVDLIISCVQNPTRPTSAPRPSDFGQSANISSQTIGNTFTDDLRLSTSQSTPSDESSSVNLGSDWEIVNPNGQTNARTGASTNSSSNSSSLQSSETSTPAAGSSTSANDVVILQDYVEDLGLNDGEPETNNSTLASASRRYATELPRESLSRSFDSRSNILNGNLDNSLSKSTESLSGNFRLFNIEDIQSEDDIRKLSVRQLKLILTRNYVNYHGCCEKDELQAKTIRLWVQVRKDKEVEYEQIKNDELCKICMACSINCVILDCGHYVTCIDCAKRLTECPICRQYVVRALRIFKS